MRLTNWALSLSTWHQSLFEIGLRPMLVVIGVWQVDMDLVIITRITPVTTVEPHWRNLESNIGPNDLGKIDSIKKFWGLQLMLKLPQAQILLLIINFRVPQLLFREDRDIKRRIFFWDIFHAVYLTNRHRATSFTHKGYLYSIWVQKKKRSLAYVSSDTMKSFIFCFLLTILSSNCSLI